jgi:hypothetical protein
MTTAEMTHVIGIESDKALVRGSRTAAPGKRPIPAYHSWTTRVQAEEPQQPLDEQIESVISRLQPARGRLRQLIADNERAESDDGVGGVLQLVRYFDAEDGELDGWQHRLLGWEMTPATVDFLADVGASVAADEYGQDLPWWRVSARRRYASVDL